MSDTEKPLLLGVDGGGTRCRARLTGWSGSVLGESVAGPANIRLGIEQSFAAVLQATAQCLEQADLPLGEASRIVACLALAGASEPADLAVARAYRHPFRKVVFTTDAHAACIGAHAGVDGGVIIVGTGSIGWGVSHGRTYRVGGWGLPLSDEGSGAWLGREALRRVLRACDGRASWSGLVKTLFKKFDSDAHAIVQFAEEATPRDFGELAPQVVHFAAERDSIGVELMRLGAGHIDDIAARLVSCGIERIALAGGLAGHVQPWLADATRAHLVTPVGDAMQGGLYLARQAVQPGTRRDETAA